MSEHFELHTEFEFEFNWNVKEHETIMIRHMFSKKINLTPGVTVASLHRGVTVYLQFMEKQMSGPVHGPMRCHIG